MESHWWKEEALKGTVNLNDEITFFVAYGDITGRVATFVFCLLLLLGIVRGIMGRAPKAGRGRETACESKA